MNVIWCVITVISVVLMLVKGDGGVVFTTLIGSGTSALNFCLRLAAMNCIWCGIIKLAEAAGTINLLSSILKKPIRRLFGNISDKAVELVTLSIATNVSGLSGGATPAAVSAIAEMDKNNTTDASTYPMTMLFVINACGLSVIPSTVIGMRAQAGAVVPADIVLPNLIVSSITTALGILGTMLLYRKESLFLHKKTAKSVVKALKSE